MKTPALLSVLAVVLVASSSAGAAEKGEEVEFSSGAVTALSCALEAQRTGKLDRLNSCPLSEARKGIVVFDVSEMVIYRLAKESIPAYELERAFAGGAIDVTGTVSKTDRDGVAVVAVEEYSITPKPKAGSFKGCL